MSIANEILRLQQAKSDLAASIANKGVTVPAATTLDGYAALVDSIGALPYDSKIEFLQTTGTQYINTGITLASNTTEVKLVFDVALTEFTTTTRMIAHSTPNGGIQVYSGYIGALNRIYNQGANLTATANTFYTITTTTTASQRTIQLNSGTPATQSFSRSITDNSTLEICGFPDWVSTEQCSKGKYRSFNVFINGKLVRAYIPVRVGQTGYFYDYVSGQLFGNAGTGSFILGSDKN